MRPSLTGCSQGLLRVVGPTWDTCRRPPTSSALWRFQSLRPPLASVKGSAGAAVPPPCCHILGARALSASAATEPGRPVEELPCDVEMPGMSRSLLDHVQHDPTNIRRLVPTVLAQRWC